MAMNEPIEHLPRGWFEGSVKDIADVNPPVPLGDLPRNLPVSFVAMTDVSETGRVTHMETRPLGVVASGFTRFIEGDILFAKITPCMQNGKGAHACGLKSGRGFGSTEFHVLRANSHGDPRFLYHLTRWPLLRNRAVTFFSGSAGQQRVSAEFFGRFRLALPPLDEQRRIAEILSSADELIEKTEALVEKQKVIKRGLMHDLLTRGVDDQGRSRPSPEQAPASYKMSAMGPIPLGWSYEGLGSYLAGIDAGWSPDCIEQPPSAGEWGVLKVSAVTSGIFRPEESKTLPPHLSPRPQFAVEAGDVLLARSNGVSELVGVTAQVHDAPPRLMLSDKLLRLRPTSRLLRSFLVALMQSERTRRQILQALNGSSGQQNVSQADIRLLRVTVPPIDEQHRVTDVLEAAEVTLRRERDYLAKLQKMKLGLMEDLLTGKVRVEVSPEGDAA